jgi:SAM-dependent methyltransferase
VDAIDWDVRYSSRELVWGSEPNRFVAEELESVAPAGRALDLACGEGRNAIWLAARGWSVTAVDFSEVAIGRAGRLAARKGVEVEWVCADLISFVPEEGAFELVLIAYLHLLESGRREALAQAALALAPGGDLYMVGHARHPLNQGLPGPKDPGVLWDPEQVAAELLELGLVLDRCQHVRRPIETSEGGQIAIDTEVRAHRPDA